MHLIIKIAIMVCVYVVFDVPQEIGNNNERVRLQALRETQDYSFWFQDGPKLTRTRG